jgi:hypothetical protein
VNNANKTPPLISKRWVLVRLQTGLRVKLFLVRRVYGAHTGAGTAGNTYIGIDNVDRVALGDAVYGAFGNAGSAFNAIAVDNVSHFYISFFNLLLRL